MSEIEATLSPQAQGQQPGRRSEMTPPPQSDCVHYRGSGKLQNKAALITGGDSGIGRAISVLFAKEGADIAISFLNEHKDVEEVTRRFTRRAFRPIRHSIYATALFACTSGLFAQSVYVTNERSGNLTVIASESDAVVKTIPVGKRPRGVRCSPDGKRVYVALSGSPRMAPGVDADRAPADKTADGIGVVDVAAPKLVEKWHAGSDPEQFALSKDGALAFIANEDEASLSIVDLTNGQLRGKVKVSEEPEGVGVNPVNGEVYVTCEAKGEVFVISPAEQSVVAKIDVGGRPRSVAFSADGQRAYVTAEAGGYVSVVDAVKHSAAAKITLPQGSLPMTVLVSPDGDELYVTTGRGNSVAVIKASDNSLVAMIPVGGRVWGAALTADGAKLYTANGASNDVSIIDVKARKEITRVKVGDGPWGVAIGPKL